MSRVVRFPSVRIESFASGVSGSATSKIEGFLFQVGVRVVFEIGVVHFGEMAPQVGVSQFAAGDRLSELRELAAAAEAAGLDVFAVGEHHRPDFAVSAPVVILTALAGCTERITLSSALTVLASDDPVRLFEQFATLDLLSGDRAELMVGRDGYPEAFTLFGHRLTEDERLLRDKLALLLSIRDGGATSWRGASRPPLRGVVVGPRPRRPLPVGVTTQRSVESAGLAGEHGLPLEVIMSGGAWQSYTPVIERFRADAAQTGRNGPPVYVASPGHLAATAGVAFREAVPYLGGAVSPEGVPEDVSSASAYAIGDPSTVIDKVLAQHARWGHDRFLLQLGVGGMPIDASLQAIDLLGRLVAPVVREIIATRAA